MEDNEKVVNAEADVQETPAAAEEQKAEKPVQKKAEAEESAATAKPASDNNTKEQTKPAESTKPAETVRPATEAARPAPAYRGRPQGDRPHGDRPQRNYGPRPRRRKVCQFCVDRQEFIDYKDAGKLRKFMSERAKILPRRVTGTCAQHQRELTIAVKKARQIALLPYVSD